jgi:protein-tyrosine phosphatase
LRIIRMPTGCYRCAVIDIHCHILPGLDDGPREVEEALEMCRVSLAEGVTAVIATPHLYQGMFQTDRESILESYALVREALESEKIPLKLYVGADVHLVPDLGKRLEEGAALTLNRSPYLLLELPARVLPPNLNEIIYGLLSQGYVPILTHPERNDAILRRQDILLDLLHYGALCQITAMSVTGEFGTECERFACALIEAGAAHFIASDAHSTTWRSPGLMRAVQVAEEIVGKEKARCLVQDYPEAVLSGHKIETVEVKKLPKRKRFWLF